MHYKKTSFIKTNIDKGTNILLKKIMGEIIELVNVTVKLNLK